MFAKVQDIVRNMAAFERPNVRPIGRKIKYFLLGREINDGIIFKLVLYVIFISTSYIYLNPILKMLIKMIMTQTDLLNPEVQWVPSAISFEHLEKAWTSLKYGKSVMMSLVISLLVAVFHCISCGFAGYAFAKLQFPFKKLAFFLLFVAFIIPPQVVVLPTIIAFRTLHLVNSMFALIVPALFGFGVKGSLFVLIYRQFFLTQPKELMEAARIDGATAFRFYRKVMFPLARPAIIVVFLFSFVWTWNDTYFVRMFMGTATDVPLAMQMSRLSTELKTMLAGSELPEYITEPIKMAASFLTIMPPLILYLFTQRYFVESVERTGIVD